MLPTGESEKLVRTREKIGKHAGETEANDEPLRKQEAKERLCEAQRCWPLRLRVAGGRHDA